MEGFCPAGSVGQKPSDPCLWKSKGESPEAGVVPPGEWLSVEGKMKQKVYYIYDVGVESPRIMRV
jgi:hypothetical protein